MAADGGGRHRLAVDDSGELALEAAEGFAGRYMPARGGVHQHAIDVETAPAEVNWRP
jgi:hypothetical protein